MSSTSDPPPKSVDALVQAISEETAAPSVVVLLLPRPHPLSRLLAVMVVVLLVGLAWLSWTLIGGIGVLGGIIREHQQMIEALPTPAALPAAAELLDDAVFADILHRRPDDAARLHAGRGQALAAVGRWEEAITSFTTARKVSLVPLPAVDRIAHADALLHAGWYRQARTAIEALPFATLAPAERTSAAAVLSGCLLAERQAERAAAAGGVPPASPTSSPARAEPATHTVAP